MGEKILMNKKIMLLAIFLVSLLAISAVSAADDGTADIVSSGDSTNADDILEEVNSNSTFAKGTRNYGHIGIP